LGRSAGWFVWVVGVVPVGWVVSEGWTDGELNEGASVVVCVLTVRDGELVEWLGRLGAGGVEHVMARFGIGRTVAYRRLAACVQAGVVERARLVHGEPSLYVATRLGLAYVGLSQLEVRRVSVASVRHWHACADVALGLAAEGRVRSVRELRVAEREAGRPIASARIGDLPGGRPKLHRPDLVLGRADGSTVAIEVELAVKGASRLERILRGYAHNQQVTGVRYYASPQAARAVRRASRLARTTDLVEVHALAGTEGKESRRVAA
jgi:hypothetical protein